MLFDKPLEGPAKELFSKLYTTSFDADGLRAELKTGKYDAYAVNAAAIEYVEECGINFDHWSVSWDDWFPGETVPDDVSSHLAEVIGILLDYGLDPNWIFREETKSGSIEEYNIMEQLQLVFNGHQAADALYLLLSHGGNPNLVVHNWPLSFEPEYDAGFDTIERQDVEGDSVPDIMYEAKIHYWLVLTGFRAAIPGEDVGIEPVKGYDLTRLREHRYYYVGAIRSDKSPDGWDLCVFDRRTNWEVARF